jgi:predicted N-formylglutamate amidohydrolase
MASHKTRLLLTCEHGGNRAPREYVKLFRSAQTALDSHRGYDPGALELGKLLAKRLQAPFVYSTTTRLLVELNRSLHHRHLFSEFTRLLSPDQKRSILARHYHPYRRQVNDAIAAAIDHGDAVLHVSVHSFTPELNGQTRHADIGLLYDPSRPREKRLTRAWRDALRDLEPELRVRRNYPYLGKADGLTTYLRRRWSDDQYAGIELEVNQLWPEKPAAQWRRLKVRLAESLRKTIAEEDT